jgi:D-alanine-D-alanine ligase
VFNLVESLGGSDRLIALVPLLLESLGIAYTGVSAEGLMRSSSKTTAKKRLNEASLPTLPWVELNGTEGQLHGEDAVSSDWPSSWIRKPIYEHASLGMTDDAVVSCVSPADVTEKTAQWQQQLGRPCFAEPFIDGREFNLSLLAGDSGPEVLPAAEIDFVDFPSDKPRIVGYAAKWAEETIECVNTPRRFTFSASDDTLLEHLRRITLACWNAFELSGYARFDFRVDDAGRPWILEINANPCLTPGSGFAAAVQEAGYSYEQVIGRIVDDALRRAASCLPSATN